MKVLIVTVCLAVVGVGGGLTARADLLISNYNANSIARYSDGGSFLGTLVASGGGGLDLPHRSRIGPDGALYVASAGNDRILRYDSVTGDYLGVFIEGAPSGLDYPTDLVFHTDGFLYISSQQSSEILRYDGITGAWDASFVASGAALNGPSGIAFDVAGRLYAAGRYSDNIVRFSATGVFEADWAAGDTTFGLVFGADGSLFSAAGGSNAIFRTADPVGTPVASSFATGLNYPVGIELAPDGSLAVANYSANTVERFDASTGVSLGVLASGAALNGPNYLTFVAVPEPTVGLYLVGLCGVAGLWRLARRRV